MAPLTCYWPRAIIHIAMNAFFASVEQRDFPELRDKPVGVTNGNARSGEFTVAPAARLARSTMPNVIAPAWRPDGHRQHIPD